VSARPEPNPVFRESFLSHWGVSRHGRTLRAYGDLLSKMSGEAESILLRREPRSEEPPAVEDVISALVDLGPVLDLLDEVANTAERDDLPRLGRSAAGWARQIRKVAAAMEATLEKLEGEREDSTG
jgi:hypothetical protein